MKTRHNFHFLPFLIILAIAMILSGCESLGLLAPKSFKERLAATVIVVDQVQLTAKELYTLNRISKADAENVASQASSALEALQVARTIFATDPAGAEAKLGATITVLSALQAYLRAKEASK